jgi:spermidine synthase
MFVPMIDVIPKGQLGAASIDHIDVQDIDIWNARLTGSRTTPGRYCRLTVNNELMMTDTRDEQISNYRLCWRACGDVLITGLGIGMVLIPLCRKPEVASVTVVERSSDVIALVEQPLRRFIGEDAGKLAILNDDAFCYRPSRSYDVIYHDIWPTIDPENLPEITRLKRRYARALRHGGAQFAWEERRLRVMRRRERREVMRRA